MSLVFPIFAANDLEQLPKVVQVAWADLGKGEMPPGSNRGTFPDLVNAEFGSPVGSAWCGNVLARWLKAGGLPVPPQPGAARSWIGWGSPWLHDGEAVPAITRYLDQGIPTSVVYRALDGKAEHVGLVIATVRMHERDVLISIEGNTSLGRYDRDGWIVALKEVDLSRVLGFGILQLPHAQG